ncbi:MAG: hypothetical protein L6Q92_13715 [Phycisphaerae bacterium]|nr:hypothetical protein [Phycisphaerae bacterium]
MLFDYDWWFGDGLARQVAEARRRCAAARLGKSGTKSNPAKDAVEKHAAELDMRIIVYLKDSAIYEVKELANLGRTDSLTFECQPADDAYRVGSFVVTVPFEEIARVEVFAVHPKEKPEDSPLIKGFGTAAGRPHRGDERPDEHPPRG